MNLCDSRDVGIGQPKPVACMTRAFIQPGESSRSRSVKRQHAARKKRQHTVAQRRLKRLAFATTRQPAQAVEQFRDIDSRQKK